MPSNWAKGFTKDTHPSVLKISETMRRKKIDNFAAWRERARASGVIPSHYPVFIKDGNFAELLGVVYGDGNIGKFPRSERLVIAANSNNKSFINRYRDLVEKLFKKKPTLMKAPKSNCVRISIYQQKISERLGIPSGDKRNIRVSMPNWIKNNHDILIRFLRGLFEAEGTFCIHKPTSTYKFIFNNKNKSLLKLVFDGLIMLGFHPNVSGYKVQLSRKEEVYRCVKLLRFRMY